MRYFLRFVLLALGFALTTAGLMFWHGRGFTFVGVWPASESLQLHPLHLLIVGLAMIPPSLWEIFLLEQQRYDER